MSDIDWAGEAPCRADFWPDGCECSSCLVNWNRMDAVVPRLLAVRERWIEDHWIDAREAWDEEHPTAERDASDPGLADWYVDDLARMDAFLAQLLGEPAGPWLSRTAVEVVEQLTRRAVAHEQAPCQAEASLMGRCTCPEHIPHKANTIAVVTEALLGMRRTTRMFSRPGLESLVDPGDQERAANAGGWLSANLRIDIHELGAVEELVESGLTAQQALRAISLTREG